MDTYHRLPILAISEGLDTVEYTFHPTSAKHPHLVIISRMGLGGDTVSHGYTIHPQVPPHILREPKLFLSRLADLLKFQNYDRMSDLWPVRLFLDGGPEEGTGHDIVMTDMDKYLHDMLDPKRLHMNVDAQAMRERILFGPL